MTAQTLLTPAQVAERLNVSLRTAYDMLAPGGALSHLRIQFSAKTIRVDPLALEDHINDKAASNADR